MTSPPVLFLPIIEWSFRQQRPQQLARCFSRAGYRVYYPDLRLKGDASPMRLVEGSIWRFGLRGRDDFDPYHERMTDADAELALASIVESLPAGGLEGIWVVAQLPAWRSLAELVRKTFHGAILFDCLDDFAAFSEHGDLSDEEMLLARTADLVVTTAQVLYDRLAPLSRHCALIRNGCDPEHFAPVVARPRAREHPTIGYFGGIHDWFDTELVLSLAEARPDWRFLLAGDTYHCDVAPLLARSNVAMLGEVPYGELPRVVSAFDAGLIPFRINPLTLSTNPVKVYEMFAAGLPVVAVDLPELRVLEPWVTIAGTTAEFVEAFERALAEPATEPERRARFAAEHSWSHRFWDLRRAMDAARPSGVHDAPTDEIPGPLDDDGSRATRWLEGEQRHLATLESLALARAERASLVEERDRAHREIHSLLEQRERVHAEAMRLQSELDRVEAERVALEHAAARRGFFARWLRR